jgi:hypothetical protein
MASWTRIRRKTNVAAVATDVAVNHGLEVKSQPAARIGTAKEE